MVILAPMTATLTLRVPDPEGRWEAVRLCSDLHLDSRELERRDGDWVLELPPLALQRLEYQLELVHPDGGTETVRDPSHDVVAPGVFGAKSVLEAASYARPAWLDAEAPAGTYAQVRLGPAMRRQVSARVWSPTGLAADRPAPALLVHDGPEYDQLARLSQWAAVMVDAGRLPPLRLVLLPPGDRDNWYSASEGYARALAGELVPELRRRVPVEGPLAGAGASLGALALLHLHRRQPDVFGGLFLQSGSYFTPETDPQEMGFARFGRIAPVVRGALRARRAVRPIPIVITCGAEEENHANNALMAEALERQGHPVRFVSNPDLHNYTGWRDCFDPHLTDLLAALWG
jgi:enterochelin esterase family protein